MNRPLSKKPDRSGKRPSSLRRLFVPTLLCLALFPASFALAEMSGGYENIPESGDYGNKDSLTGNDVRITGKQIRGSVYGAYAKASDSSENATATINNSVTISSRSKVTGNIYGGFADDSISENATVTANGNSVTVSGNSEVNGDISGGFAEAAFGNKKTSVTANDNSVTVSGSTVNGTFGIYGGEAYIKGNGDQTATAEANNNSVTVSNGSTTNGIYGGYASATGNQTAAAEANNNSVTVSNGSTVERNVFGSYAEVSLYENETSTSALNDESEGQYQNTSYSEDATAKANNNSVDVSGSETKVGYIYGGEAYIKGNGNQTATAEANNNSVTVSDKSTAKGIYGGKAHIEGNGSQTATARANGNSVTVSDSTVDGDDIYGAIYGGDAHAYGSQNATAKANNNSVTVSGSTVNDNNYGIYGGYTYAEGNQTATAKAKANGNSVTVSDKSTVNSGNIYGGIAWTSGNQNSTLEAKANGNSVTVSNGSTVNGAYGIYGGEAYIEGNGNQTATAEANNNSVDVSGSETKVGYIYGGEAYIKGNGNQTATAEANNNSVTVSGDSKVKNIYGGEAEATGDQTATAKANGNSVTVFGSETKVGDIYGGYTKAHNSKKATAEANGNNVTVSGDSKVKNIYGGEAEATGDQTATAKANGNSVTVFGSETKVGDIYGGYTKAHNSKKATAEANNNSVTVSNGSTVNGDIFGGYADAYYGTQNTEYATGNTVTIDSATVESGNTIVGGAVYIDDENDTHIATGNTVTLTGNYTIDGTSLYGGYNGNVNKKPNGSDDLFSGNTLNLDARKVATTTRVEKVANFETINIRAGNINNGDTVLQTSGTILGNGKTGAEAKGTTVNLISIENPSLKAGDKLTLISDTEGTLANDKEKQFVQKGENFAVGYDAQIEKESGNVIASIEGNKLNPETKILNENRAASLAFINSGTDLLLDTDIGKGKNIFGAIRGGHSRYETGSSVEIDGVNLITGFAHTQTGENGDITGGAFIEAGWGDTATHNTLGGKRLKGNGNTHYYGAGILGRYEWTRGAVKGLYADAAVRAGKLSSDYHNNDATNIKGQRVSYDIDSTYYAAHLGIGYQWDMTNALRLDTSAQYMWAHVDSENTTILGERYHLDAMDSHRTRVGVKLNYTAEPQYTPYIGIAWEHEFDGKAKSSVEGYAIDEADLGGSSGIVTLGVDFKPSENSPLTLEAGVTGYVGQHEGVAGQFRMQYTF